MSSSTISTVNKYLLSGEIVPTVPTTTLRQSNMNFPTSFTGMTTTMANYNNIDCRHIFSSGMSGTAWRDVSGGYQLLVSSNVLWAGTQKLYASTMFDGDNGTTAWSNNLGSAGVNSSNIILDGVNLGKFTQNPYQASSPFGYVGGGTNYFYTTVYNINQSASGEWFQFKAPFQILLKSITFKNRNTRITSAPKTVVLLGSDDGLTWTLIETLNYTTFTNNVAQVRNVTTTSKWYHFRCIFTNTQGFSSLEIGEMSFIYDAYA